jgi:hypothetical protein
VSWLTVARKAVLGETWVLPLGVAILIGAAALLDAVAPDAFEAAGAPLLAAGVVALLLLAVAGEARGRSR